MPLIDQDKSISTYPRKPVVAALLSLFPGLGQIYNGQLVKGILFFWIDVGIPVLFGITGAALTANGLMFMVVIAIAFIIYRIADGFIVAKRLKSYELKPVNKVYVYVLFGLLTIACKMYVDIPTSTGIQTYRIPTPSMVPTLVPGDMVAAQTYKDKDTEIQCGDIVTYNSPLEGIWISRIVAMPGDSIKVVDGIVSVNGQPNKVTKIKEYTLDEIDVIEFEEELKNGKKIKTLRWKYPTYSEGRNMASKLVPANEYFLMGDSRDDALDSRFFGTLKKEDVLGKVIYRYWPRSSEPIL